MHAAATKHFIKLADQLDHPIADLVCDSTECDIVVPSILRAKLEAAGYKIADTEMKVLHKVEVMDPRIAEESESEFHARQALAKAAGEDPDALTRMSALIAIGTSDAPADALLQAVRALLREASGDRG